ncbi:MAG: carboxynorspermidine decarboxylase [Flavobacteriales bacterium]|nr:carboxynorspermidine decarboxylase [Flavobacteriales bacterium]
MNGFYENISSIPNPCFVLDEVLFEQNMTVLGKLEEQSGAQVLCALKGFSMWEVFPLMMNYLSGGTASSLNEARLIYDKMGKKAHSCFVVYDSKEFIEVQELSSHITFNSLTQFERFKNQLKENVNYALRVNPEFSNVSFNQYNPCVPGSRFGVTIEDLPEELPNQLSGLHFHTLCESSAEDFKEVLDVIELRFGNLLHSVKWVNFGGGHHITKKGYNIELLSHLLSNVRKKYNLQVYIEPGEAIGLNAGFLLSKVEDIVINQGEKTAILNVSFAAHMPDCLEMPYKPEVIDETEVGHSFTLGGNTCMSGDFVKGFQFSKELEIGQLLVFKDMAHYTFVKTSFFNGVKHPSLGIWTKNNEFRLLKEFTFDDFKYRLS